MKNEIVERSSGFWIVSSDGDNAQGPFTTVEDAQDWLKTHCSYCGSGLLDGDGVCQECGL